MLSNRSSPANTKRSKYYQLRDSSATRYLAGASHCRLIANCGKTMAAQKALYKPTLLNGCRDKARKQRMRLKRPGLELGMKLHPNKPGMA
jgi:hypothetical protein